MGGECPYGHEWTHYNSTCPYGRSLPGSVTLPNLADLTFDMQVATILCVGWSLLPFVIMGLGAVQAILSRGTRLWSFMIFAVSITVLNELILKRIFQMPRPYQSCSTSCGMPSGHSTLAMGFLALCVHDIIYLYNSQDTRAELTEESSNYKCRECCATCCGREFWASPWKWLGKDCKTFVSPLSGDVYLTRRHALARFYKWFALLGPVPLCRTTLHDHSTSQVMIGAVLGISEAILWTWLVRHMSKKCWNKVGHYLVLDLCPEGARWSRPRFKLVHPTEISDGLRVGNEPPYFWTTVREQLKKGRLYCGVLHDYALPWHEALQKLEKERQRVSESDIEVGHGASQNNIADVVQFYLAKVGKFNALQQQSMILGMLSDSRQVSAFQGQVARVQCKTLVLQKQKELLEGTWTREGYIPPVCPKNHELQPGNALHKGTWKCHNATSWNGCRGSQIGVCGFRCFQCGYELCAPCFARAQTPSGELHQWTSKLQGSSGRHSLHAEDEDSQLVVFTAVSPSATKQVQLRSWSAEVFTCRLAPHQPWTWLSALRVKPLPAFSVNEDIPLEIQELPPRENAKATLVPSVPFEHFLFYLQEETGTLFWAHGGRLLWRVKVKVASQEKVGAPFSLVLTHKTAEPEESVWKFAFNEGTSSQSSPSKPLGLHVTKDEDVDGTTRKIFYRLAKASDLTDSWGRINTSADLANDAILMEGVSEDVWDRGYPVTNLTSSELNIGVVSASIDKGTIDWPSLRNPLLVKLLPHKRQARPDTSGSSSQSATVSGPDPAVVELPQSKGDLEKSLLGKA